MELPKRVPFNQWRIQEFLFGWEGSTNSVEDRGQRERESGGGGGRPPSQEAWRQL